MSNKAEDKAMKSAAKHALVPKLRFPEFREAEEWEEKKLIDTAAKTVKWSFIGGPFGSNLKSSDYVDDGIRIIQLQNIGDAEFNDDYRIFTSEEKADELLSNNIYPGDIILSKMGDPVGRACLIPDTHNRYVMCSDGIRLVVDEKSNSKYFIYSLINSMKFRSLVEKTATGSTRKRIGLDELKNLPMLLPKKVEQQKIADCLSSLDELLILEAQKLDTLKTHKKGLMQQLFPAEGETLPKLRFPEFRDAGGWEEKPLGKVCDVLNNRRKPITSSDRVSGPYPYYGASGIVDYVNDFIFDERILLIGEDGAKWGAYEKTAFIVEGKCWVNNHAHVLIAHGANDTLLENYLTMLDLGPFITGAAPPKLTLGKLKGIPVPVPSSAGEQQRIADCLSSIDELITAQTQKIDTLRAHKKGLMQQLFPALDEVQE